MLSAAADRLRSHGLASTSTATPSHVGALTRPGPRGLQVLQRQPRVGQPSGTRRTLARAARDEPEFAVFRFTLGIPGFDDALIPRVVGALGVLLLVLNHVLNDAASSAGQVRAEALGAALAGLCMLIPSIEKRIEEVAPGRGRGAAGSGAVEGAVQLFLLQDALNDAQKQELAWATYVLLKNTNTAGALVLNGSEVLAARGAQSAALLGSRRDISLLSLAVQASGFGSSARTAAYYPDRAALGGLGDEAGRVLPPGAQCLLLARASQDDGSGLRVAVWADSPRAFSQRDRRWVASIADKLAPSFQ